MILQLYHLPPPRPPPVSNSSCLFIQCQLLYANHCTVLLYISRHCTIRLKILSLFSVGFYYIYYLHKKYYKHITVQYCTTYCVSWAPWLTLLDLLTCSQNGTHLYVEDLLYNKMIVSFVCIRNRNVFAIKGKCHKKAKRK